ncbi:MazG nucleotide pyrophosphohydrolase domain-containing protein [Halothiobacillus sp. DCM-1]|uniref:MazG nucleotide pyrophosphohydrolase domain-containing protein n=1 Tax=Halothiobacillus sp. DCM-1 TaxID=3112558 RepID=UPI00324F9C1F
MSGISLFDKIPDDLPVIQRALALQQAAASIGFEWPSVADGWCKLQEELVELADAMARQDGANMAEELGDALFALVNLARQLQIDPAQTLQATNEKFIRRLQHMERAARAEGACLADEPLAVQIDRYCQAKTAETGGVCQRS